MLPVRVLFDIEVFHASAVALSCVPRFLLPGLRLGLAATGSMAGHTREKDGHRIRSSTPVWPWYRLPSQPIAPKYAHLTSLIQPSPAFQIIFPRCAFLTDLALGLVIFDIRTAATY